MTHEDPSQRSRGLLTRLLARSSTGGLGAAGLALALVLAVAGGSAWLLTPSAWTQRTPGDDALGTPALANFKASRADFADCLIGVINNLAGCESTLTFDRSAASLRAFKQV